MRSIKLEKDVFERLVKGHHAWLSSGGSDGAHADFSGNDLTGFDLSGLMLQGAFFKGADLQGANLSGANLFGCSFKKANLQGANFSMSVLPWASFDDAALDGAEFTGAQRFDDDPPIPGWTLKEIPWTSAEHMRSGSYATKASKDPSQEWVIRREFRMEREYDN